MKESLRTRKRIILSGTVLVTTAGATATLVRYLYKELRKELIRRGYSTWDECDCDFKTQSTIFQVWHSRLAQRGETIVAQEWGLYLVRPPQWLRRTLHYSSQVIAIINPRKRHIERVTLSPQQSYQFASLLHARATNEDLPELIFGEEAFVTWRREILHYPSYLFDACLSRLYPVNIAPEKVQHVEGLPALWDATTNLPLPTEGPLLDTPVGTQIDCIGWSPTQIAYCTARLKPQTA